jgi:hypothetical protein
VIYSAAMNSAHEQSDIQPSQRIDLLKAQMLTHVDLYKTHFELFLKGTALYLGLVGAVVGFALKSKPDGKTLCGLSILLALGSIIGIVGGAISKEWIRKTKQILSDVCKELQLACVPLESAERIVTLEQSISILLLIVGLIAAVYFGVR